MKHARNSGFTLIELSIVLVIIGLIAGGILAGRELIAQAQIRKDIALIQGIVTAVHTFKLKYNQLPGDMTNPQAVFNVPYAGYGNGDGSIGTMDPATDGPGLGCKSLHVTNLVLPYNTGETMLAFDQLARAGLLAMQTYDVTDWTLAVQPGVGYPRSFAYPSAGIVITACEGKNYLVWGAQNQSPGMAYVSFNRYLPTIIPAAIDAKLDDGAPNSGRILNRGLLNTEYLYTGQCYAVGTNVYYYTDQATYLCPLRIEAGF